MVGGAFQIVDQDWPADADLVPEEAGAGQLGFEAVVSPDLLAGMGLAGVDEYPTGVRMTLRCLAQQRTLCRAVWSGEGPEFHHQIAACPEIRESDLAAVVEQDEGGIRRLIAGVESIREGGELSEVDTGFHVFVEALVVVLARGHRVDHTSGRALPVSIAGETPESHRYVGTATIRS